MIDIDKFEANAINTIRFLSADGVQQAKSGHPGLPMGAAVMAYTIWTRHLRHNPLNPNWFNRDRFVLSGGHGSMLLYSLLHLTGYDLSLDELKKFRQLNSLTPGHPEYGLTPGVEVTTGPLGQGFSNGVGMAIAESHLAATFNKPGFDIVDHFVYAIVTDGDLMEGVTAEAASLAGHLQLGKLIYLYDDNRISIDGSTDLAFTEDRAKRFESYGWHVQLVADGNDIEAVDSAIHAAKNDQRPSIIVCRTTIGYGLPTKQGTAKAHGEAPGDEELNSAKEAVGWPVDPRFYIPEDVLDWFRKAKDVGYKREQEWQSLFLKYQSEYPQDARELSRRLNKELTSGWETNLPNFSADPKGMSTRAASGKVINALAEILPELIGGSADLAPSNNTWISGYDAFQKESPEGRNFHFGVREHAMGSIVNGMAVHGGVIPYGATFLVFSDYMRPPVRLSALSHYPSIWIYTHDSIGVGEDGPTHQPVEHIAGLRAIPNLVVIRPMDANEVSQSWKVALERRAGPTALLLTRQNIPVFDRTTVSGSEGLIQGAYVLADLGHGTPQLILLASGSEVSLAYEAGKILAEAGISTRIVSFPSWELFAEQDETYQNSVLPPTITARVAVEAGVAQGWHRWVGNNGKVISVDKFGASGPIKDVMVEYGMTVEAVAAAARSVIG